MLIFDPAFRTLLLKRIRGLTNENLSAYEGLTALQVELIQILRTVEPEIVVVRKVKRPYGKIGYKKIRKKNPVREGLIEQIKEAERRAHDIIKDFEKEFNALHKLWIARRRFALQRGNYFPIPLSLGKLRLWKLDWWKFNGRKLWCCCSDWFKYRGTQIVFVWIRVQTTWKRSKNVEEMPGALSMKNELQS